MDIRGKNVVVTGGARGIGLAFVQALSANGANVLVLDRNFKNSPFEEMAGILVKRCIGNT